MSPNLNAFVERFIQTLGQECLDHFVVLGEGHMNRIMGEFERYESGAGGARGDAGGGEVVLAFVYRIQNIG